MPRRRFGELEQTLLYAVVALEDEPQGASGPTIRALIARRTGRSISPGAIFTALARLEERGFVSSVLGDPPLSAAANANACTGCVRPARWHYARRKPTSR